MDMNFNKPSAELRRSVLADASAEMLRCVEAESKAESSELRRSFIFLATSAAAFAAMLVAGFAVEGLLSGSQPTPAAYAKSENPAPRLPEADELLLSGRQQLLAKALPPPRMSEGDLAKHIEQLNELRNSLN